MVRVLLALLLLGARLAAAEGLPGVETFSPEGEARDLRQVAVRFATPMVSFGDPAQALPFEVDCPAAGNGRWVDERHWVYDFGRELSPGLECRFRLRQGLADRDGRPLPLAVRQFHTGGPSVRESVPWDGHTAIDEAQVFVLGLDAPATDESVAAHVWCQVTGRAERVPVRVVSGKERQAVLEGQRDFVAGFAESRGLGAEVVRRVRARDFSGVPLQVVACRSRLPYEALVNLVWGAGVATPGGVASASDQVIHYRVRPAFSASFTCPRTNERSHCIPVLAARLSFTAPVSLARARKVRLTGPDGQIFPARFEETEERAGQVSGIDFPGPFPEASSLVLSLPAGLVDDAGRPLSNARSFPLTIRTDPAPPLAKFAARFGILELNADPALPITLRHVERELAGRTAALVGQGGGKGLDARRLRVQDPTRIVDWLRRLQASEARWTDKGYVSPSVFAPGDVTQPMTLPKPGPEREFEVVGIPLREPGLHVVEVTSPRLGQALLKDGAPYHVAAAALVTNLAVHLKRGRESSLVWVTSLDQGRPVAGAEVTVMDCKGRVYHRGRSDASGVVRVRQALPDDQQLPGCLEKWDRQLFVTARKGTDASFLFSGWDEGIDAWRFQVRTGFYTVALSAVTVFDRTLVRAGETVGMKHFIRDRTSAGLAFVPKGRRPARVVVRHVGSGQAWSQPLVWETPGAAESSFTVPPDARLGEYVVSLAPAPDRGEEDISQVVGHESGSFRVEAFRVPTLKATVQLPSQPLVAAAAADVDLQLVHLSGGAASGERVRLRALVRAREVSFPAHPGVRFANGDVREGRHLDGVAADPADETGEPTPSGGDETRVLAVRTATLDGGGGARVRIDDLPRPDVPRELVAEMEYADANGQVLSRSAATTVWPSGVVLGVRPDDWALSRDKVKATVVVLDPAGRPQAGVPVRVDLLERRPWSHRKRLVGGFYAWENGEEVVRAGDYCEGTSDATGLVQCEAPVSVSGNLILRAAARDAAGNPATAHAEVWVAGAGEWWFQASNDDRMDVVPERRGYEPGETAVLQVRSPFRQSTALVTVEREGVLDGFVTTLSGKAPVVKVPLRGAMAPNVFVSVLAVRGRVAGVQPTALADLGRPALRMGVTEVQVGWRDHSLGVTVTPSATVHRTRDRARVALQVRRADGSPPPAGTEVAVAAVDEGLLELLPNDSWKLLEAMMAPRGIEVASATSVLRVVGKRHFGRKAVAAGGGGGRTASRELFDTLLLWKPRVRLDEEGRAELEIPLNDTLGSFRVVAVAAGGASLFGTGSATLRTHRDVILQSGLPPVVREGDRLVAGFTVRNAGAEPRRLAVSAVLASAPGRADALPKPELQTVDLAPGQSASVTWSVVVPAGTGELTWDVAARPEGGEAADGDRLTARQRVLPLVPVQVQQATLVPVTPGTSLVVSRPEGALPGRGGVAVQLARSLGEDLEGVREAMRRYPHTCLEQRASRAVALRDQALWRAVMASLPAHLDDKGLLKYFPGLREGSDVLTAYLMTLADAAGWSLPDPVLPRLRSGLSAFLAGTVVRDGPMPAADLALRKVAAMAALLRQGEAPQAQVLSTFTLEPERWPTSAVIDWLEVARRWEDMPERAAQFERAERVLRARMDLRGTVFGFSTERSDRLWWLMVSPEANASRALVAVADLPGWRDDLPRMAQGLLARRQAGHWGTTVANAWGVLAMERFARGFEGVPVSGTTTVRLGAGQKRVDWRGTDPAPRLELPWPSAPATLSIAHEGRGQPWATVTSRAAIPLREPVASGYRVSRSVVAPDGASGPWRRGTALRVRIEVEAQADMAWVALEDPLPAGATVLGGGLGGESAAAAAGAGGEGAMPDWVERGFESYRAYFRFLPRGRTVLEYTMRLDNPGTFHTPPTRVEAMYAPEVHGEIPHAPVVVAE